MNLFSSVTTILILGLIVRLLPAAFTAHPLDIESWKAVGAAIYSGQNPYALPAFGLVYPPLWGFICGMAYAIYASTQSALMFNFVIKLPIILADLALAITIKNFVLAKTANEKKAKEALALYLFNPMTIILSGIWGMFDAIPVFLVLLSTILLLKTQYLKSSIVFGFAIAFKGFYPAMLLPLFSYIIIRVQGKIREGIKYLALSAIVPFAISMPFLIADASAFFDMTTLHFAQRPLSNLTYWYPVHLVLPQYQNLLSNLGFTSFIVLFSVSYIYLAKLADLKTITLSMTQIILAFFLTSPTVNEQYITWLLMPMILYVTIEQQSLKKLLYVLTGIVTVFTLANTGPSFFSPLHLDLDQIHGLWPLTLIMVVCSVFFVLVSLLVLQKTIKQERLQYVERGISA